MDKQEFKMFDENTLKDELICANCDKLLNIAPIYCIERDGVLEKMCGRCVHVVDRNPDIVKSRQQAYEIFAKYVTYPCCYKKFGCDAILCWNEVLTHESMCDFQVAKCPLFHKNLFPDKSCEWMGNVKKLDEHIENSHKDYILNPPQCNWPDCKENTIFFTRVGSHLVTVVIKYGEDSKYYCLLMINSNDIDSQCFRYQLELFDDDKNNSIILRKTRLEPLGFMREYLENNSKMLEIDLVRIKEMLQHPRMISSRFGIVKKNKKEIIQITGSKDHEILTSPSLSSKQDQLSTPDENMLQELECPVCNEHMIPPIYVCATGHSLCSECMKRVNSCPNCRSPLNGTRNYTLESLTRKVHYPCQNREIGCAFVTTSDKIRGHEETCELSENPCILKCEWKGLRPSMYNHLREAHDNLLLETNTMHIRDIKDKRETYQVLYVSGELFRFSTKGSNGPFKYNVQHLGMTADHPKFRYELQFCDQSPLKLHMSFTNVCQCITDNPNTAHTTGLNIPYELIKPFVFESKYYYYKINISKI